MTGKTKVLIVDDAERVRKAIGWILESDGEFEICGFAADGVECLKLMEILKPDLITLDINMPVMEGIEALKRIRQISKTIPVVIVSALPVEDDTMENYLRELGATACLSKVFGDDAIGISAFEADLLSILRQVVKAKEIT